MTFQEFIDSSLVNVWIYEKYIKVYVRKSFRSFDLRMLIPCFDIGSVEVNEKHRGEGVFTRFLTQAEQLAKQKGRGIFVESIMDPRFQQFFLKRGYTPDPRVVNTAAPSYYKINAHL